MSCARGSGGLVDMVRLGKPRRKGAPQTNPRIHARLPLTIGIAQAPNAIPNSCRRATKIPCCQMDEFFIAMHGILMCHDELLKVAVSFWRPRMSIGDFHDSNDTTVSDELPLQSVGMIARMMVIRGSEQGITDGGRRLPIVAPFRGATIPSGKLNRPHTIPHRKPQRISGTIQTNPRHPSIGQNLSHKAISTEDVP